MKSFALFTLQTAEAHPILVVVVGVFVFLCLIGDRYREQEMAQRIRDAKAERTVQRYRHRITERAAAVRRSRAAAAPENANEAA